jgi:hypothetical protein
MFLSYELDVYIGMVPKAMCANSCNRAGKWWQTVMLNMESTMGWLAKGKVITPTRQFIWLKLLWCPFWIMPCHCLVHTGSLEVLVHSPFKLSNKILLSRWLPYCTLISTATVCCNHQSSWISWIRGCLEVALMMMEHPVEDTDVC